MSILNKLNNKKKAVSPVVAAILLIGLVVVAAASLILIIGPMLNPSPTLAKITAVVDTSPVFSSTSNKTTFKLNIQNGNTADVKLVNFTITNNSLLYVAGVEITTYNPTLPSTFDAGGTLGVTTFEITFEGDLSLATNIILAFETVTGTALGDKPVTF